MLREEVEASKVERDIFREERECLCFFFPIGLMHP